MFKRHSSMAPDELYGRSVLTYVWLTYGDSNGKLTAH